MIIRRQKPKRARLPRGEGRARPRRGKAQKDAQLLCDWLQRREKIAESPSVSDALEGERAPHFLKITHLTQSIVM